MEILEEIKDKEFPKDESTFGTRESSRAVIFDENGLIPLLFVSIYNYHKLPGGGIDIGEDRKEALAREVREEVGSEIEITDEVGQITEFRSKWNLKQISYCYIGKVISKTTPNFTEEELSQGYEIIWLSLEEAISTVENDNPNDYEGYFNQKRDLVFLKRAKQLIQSN